MTRTRLCAAGAAILMLAACEGTDLERGAIGAGVGAAGSSAVGGNAAAGAAVGGLAGVVCDDVAPNLCR